MHIELQTRALQWLKPYTAEGRGHCMCKEMLVIPVVDPTKKNWKIGKNGGPRRWRGTRGRWPPAPPPKKKLTQRRDSNPRSRGGSLNYGCLCAKNGGHGLGSWAASLNNGGGCKRLQIFFNLKMRVLRPRLLPGWPDEFVKKSPKK
jgi:hypothetical protein